MRFHLPTIVALSALLVEATPYWDESGIYARDVDDFSIVRREAYAAGFEDALRAREAKSYFDEDKFFLQTRADSREQHKKILDEIQAASFAQGWVVDHQNSEPVKGKPVKGKPIEEVGQRLKEEIKKGK